MGWAVGWFWILLMGLKDSSQMSLDQHHWSFGPQAWGLEASANFGTELHHRPYGVSNNFLYLSCLHTWPNPIEWFSCGCLMVSLTWFFLHPSTLANSSTTRGDIFNHQHGGHDTWHPCAVQVAMLSTLRQAAVRSPALVVGILEIELNHQRIGILWCTRPGKLTKSYWKWP